MSLNDHLRTATGELRKAVDALKREIGELRNEENNLRIMVDKQIAQMMDEIRLREREMRNGPDKNLGNGYAQANINTLQNQISSRKNDFTNDQRRIADLIRQKEGQIVNIEGTARALAP